MLRGPAELLAAWEAGAGAPPVARAAMLVHRAGLCEDVDAALDMPLARSSELAARLHVQAFGAAVEGILPCASCGEELEVTVPLAELEAAFGEASAEVGGLVVRAPTTRDLLAAGADPDPRSALMVRCLRDRAGAPIAPAELAPEEIATADAAAEELAGLAGLVMRVRCPACGDNVSAPLDVGSLLWEQVSRAAGALLAEVAELARAFGWAEADVLALTPQRRRAYLEFARAMA